MHKGAAQLCDSRVRLILSGPSALQGLKLGMPLPVLLDHIC